MRRLSTFFLLALTAAGGCADRSSPASGGPAPGPVPAPAPLVLQVVYGSEKKTWLEEQARAFEASGARIASGRPIAVRATAMGSGEGVGAIVGGKLQPHVFSPASAAYLTLLNRAWTAKAGRTQPIARGGEPVVLSPVVIAMWKPMAEALGWPAKQLGWRDLLTVNEGGRGWAAHGRPEWGAFKFGHTHPEFSNSGLLAVLAEAYAGAGKTRGLTAADLDARPTRALISAVEGSIVHYGQSTGFFAEKMVARGPAYLSAAVLYENLVIESRGKDLPYPLVAIYPLEGTFWSDHPYALLDAPWVGPAEQEAAQRFLEFLRARPAQERALALGFRPADPAIPVGAPVDAAHGVDPRQPQTLLEVPEAGVLEKLLETWRATKRSADVVLVFDKSGSMNGAPLAAAKAGARRFLETLSDRDLVTLVFFDGQIHPPIGPAPMGRAREELGRRIDEVLADGGTALYDVLASAYGLALERARRDPARIHAVVLMTDGKDEGSQSTLAEVQARIAPRDGATPVRVFTIAYGDKAEKKVLDRIAEVAEGKSASGSAETIEAVYREMGAFF